MEETTNISWCDSTWNPWRGCDKVNSDAIWNEPFKWNRKPWVCDVCDKPSAPFLVEPAQCECGVVAMFHRRRVFSLSLGDWLDSKVPIEWLARMLDTIRQCQDIDFLLVSKRTELWRARMKAVLDSSQLDAQPQDWQFIGWLKDWLNNKPPSNVWIIASAENQEMLDKRIPELLRIPAVVRGLSCEPLLGPLVFDYALGGNSTSDFSSKFSTAGIHWIIAGGESGKGARPCNVEWIRSIVNQCKAAGVPCFVKQLGTNSCQDLSAVIPEASDEDAQNDPCAAAQWDIHRHQVPLHLKHSKGGDPAEWPKDLSVQQFPKVAR